MGWQRLGRWPVQRPDRGGERLALRYAEELLQFEVRADLAHQLSEVGVTGWDVGAKQPIEETGDASLYGGALARLTAGAAPLALPAIWGVFGNVDLGRVYVDGDSPGGWHTGGGGGLWLGFLDRRNTASLGIATSTEGTLIQAGLVFGM